MDESKKSHRSPDFILKALNKRTDSKSGKLGAGWLNEDSSITVVLDNFIQITSDPDLILTLFPNDSERFIQKAIDAKLAKLEVTKPRGKRELSKMQFQPISVKHLIKDKK